ERRDSHTIRRRVGKPSGQADVRARSGLAGGRRGGDDVPSAHWTGAGPGGSGRSPPDPGVDRRRPAERDDCRMFLALGLGVLSVWLIILIAAGIRQLAK